MRIAHVLAFEDSRPMELRGSSGRVVSYLAEELVSQGNEVMLLAETSSRQLANLAWDVVHFHLDRAEIPAQWRCGMPAVATLHAGGRGRSTGANAIGEVPLVAVSDAQRARQPSLPWTATIPQGLPETAFRFHEGRGGYLAVIGVMRPGGGIDRAIEIARRSGRRLRIALEPGEVHEPYFRAEIAPLLADPHVTLLGELETGRRNEFLGEAVALLQLAGSPANPELAAIEALASGTPVVRCGPFSTQESLAEGVVDLSATTLAEAVEAVGRVGRLERRRCREVFERRFTAAQMTRRYLTLYRGVRWPASGRSIPLPASVDPASSAQA